MQVLYIFVKNGKLLHNPLSWEWPSLLRILLKLHRVFVLYEEDTKTVKNNQDH